MNGWSIVKLPQIKDGNLVWFTKNQNYLRDALLPDNLLSYYELWIFSHEPINHQNGHLIESDELCFDNLYSFFHAPIETCDQVWDCFMDAFYLSLSREWIKDGIIGLKNEFLISSDASVLLCPYMMSDCLIIQAKVQKRMVKGLNDKTLRSKVPVILAPMGIKALLRGDQETEQCEPLLEAFYKNIFGDFERILVEENIPKWLVCQIGSKMYKYPSCLIQYCGLEDSALEILNDQDPLLDFKAQNCEFRSEFEPLDILKETEIFESTQIDAPLRISVNSVQSVKENPLQDSAKSAHMSSFPLIESKTDFFYNADTMRMDNFASLNSNFDIYMSESKTKKMEEDKMIDLNLDDVAEDDFDFFGNTGTKTTVTKLQGAGSCVFSPFSTESTPDVCSLGNPFSPHTPAAVNSVPAHPSPILENEKNVSSVDTVLNDVYDHCVSKIFSRKILGIQVESSIDMIPSKWLPFKFQNGQSDIFQKYGREEKYSYVPLRSWNVESDKLSEMSEVGHPEDTIEEEKIEYFMAGHPLDLLWDTSSVKEYVSGTVLRELMADYGDIHFTAQSLEFKKELHQSCIRLFPSDPVIPQSLAKYVMDFITARLSSALEFIGVNGRLKLQHHFDLQEAEKSSKYGKFKKKRKIADPILEPVFLNIMVNYNNKIVTAAPTILNLWDNLLLLPASGQKDTIWWTISPTSPNVQKAAHDWSMSAITAWEGSRLGEAYAQPSICASNADTKENHIMENDKEHIIKSYLTALDTLVEKEISFLYSPSGSFYKMHVSTFTVISIFIPSNILSYSDGYHLFGYFLHNLSKGANISLKTLKSIYIYNPLDLQKLKESQKDPQTINSSIFLIYSQCRSRPDFSFSPLYKKCKSNPFEPTFSLNCSTFDPSKLFSSRSRYLFVRIHSMDDNDCICVSWIDSLLEECHDPLVFSEKSRLKLLEKVWLKTISYLDPEYGWHVVITYNNPINRTELNSWKTLWHTFYDYCNSSNASEDLNLSPSVSSYASSASTPVESNSEIPLSQIDQLSVITVNSNDLIISSTPDTWLNWYKNNVSDLKNEIPCGWIYMSNHPIPVGSILPVCSGYILPSGDRINLMIGWDMKKRLIHSCFGIGGLKWTRDLIRGGFV